MSNVAYPFTLRYIDLATIGFLTWTPFNAAFEHPCFMLRINNTSDGGIFLSYDGVNAHEFIPAFGELEINFQTNASPGNYIALLPKGSIIYAQGAAAAGSSLLFEGYYNKTS